MRFIFLLPLLLILLLQCVHWRLLRQQVPERWRRLLPWALFLMHVPLGVFLGLRFSGSWVGAGQPLLRFFSLGLIGFQALSLLNLALGAAAALLFRLRRRSGSREPENASRRAFLRRAGLAGLGVGAVVSAKGYAEAHHDPELARRELRFPDLPEGLDGLRLVLLSDLHSGPLVAPEQLQRWRALAERERPELLLFGGDFVDSHASELRAVLEAFQDFPAPLGRFAVLGNHDYFVDPGPIWEGLSSIGVACLENRHVVLRRNGAELALLGLQDPMARNGRFRGVRFGPGPQPAQALEGLGEGPFRLCLSHNPTTWDQALRTGARLTLSGHTHGGQINLLPGLSTARLLTPYTAGLYEKEGQRLYVSRGLGVVGLPLRVLSPPEIAVLTLKRG